MHSGASVATLISELHRRFRVTSEEGSQDFPTEDGGFGDRREASRGKIVSSGPVAVGAYLDF